MPELTDARIAELRALCEKATPGPWEAGRPDMGTLVDGVASKWIYSGDQYCAVASGQISGNWDEVMANANLIAAARIALPAALDEIERLRSVINGLSEVIIAEGEAQAAAEAKLAGEV